MRVRLTKDILFYDSLKAGSVHEVVAEHTPGVPEVDIPAQVGTVRVRLWPSDYFEILEDENGNQAEP